jgi:hypothetical protein
MNKDTLSRLTKIGILILIAVLGTWSCTRSKRTGPDSVVRFENLVFTITPTGLSDSIYKNHRNLVPFFKIYNEEVIHIGPDTVPEYPAQLGKFTNDTLIRKVYSDVKMMMGIFDKKCREIEDAFDKWAAIKGKKRPELLVTYLSGFNQSFITLPGCLGIGVDNYLGSGSLYYQDLGIPLYMRKYMNPENLPADAVRAWLYSELPGPSAEGGFLERMIFEGKLYYIARKLLPKISESNLFHYTDNQLKWCQEQERSMWKYLAEKKILFSNERLTIRKFLEEAPFTRDFGNESPGRVGTWIGYRIVSSYMKASGISMEDLVSMTSAKEILSASKYHP